MEHQNWQKDKYLKTPEHFSETVDACVRRQLAAGEERMGVEQGNVYDFNKHTKSRGDAKMYKENKRTMKSFGWKKAVACVAALVVVVGGSAWAATNFQLGNYLGRDAGENPDEAEKYIKVIDSSSQENDQGQANHQEMGEGQTIESELPGVMPQFLQETDEIFMEPLIQLKEVYFDGSVLHVYGEATEAGKNYELATSRVFVNGTQYAADVMSDRYYDETKSSYVYHGRVQLTDAQLTDDFTVQIPFEVFSNPGSLSSRLGFHVVSVKVAVTDNAVVVIEPQTIEIDGGSVEVTEMSLTLSTMHICYTYRFIGEDAQEKATALGRSGFAANDSQGKSYDFMFDSNEGGKLFTDAYLDDLGAWCVDQEYYITGVPTDIVSLTVTPYSFKSTEESNIDLNKGEDLHYGDFTIAIGVQ